MGNENEEIQDIGSIGTFEKILESTGNLNKSINYLKIDIEGMEMKGLPQWIQSGSLDHVRQIGMEWHIEESEKSLMAYYDILQELIKKGFKLISYEVNGCRGRKNDAKIYYRFFEIVLRQSKLKCS